MRTVSRCLQPAQPEMGSAPDESPCRELDELVRRHERTVWRFLRSLGADAGVAEELAVDAFVLAWQKRLDAADDREAVAWLVATARFLWLRRCRARSRAQRREALAAEALWLRSCGDDGGDAWLAALRQCLAALAGRTAAAVRMSYGESLGRAATAAALGMTENGVKTLLQRARQRLRDCVERRLR